MSSENSDNTSSSYSLQTINDDFGLGPARWHTIGDTNNRRINFVAANGIPAGTYESFLKLFTDDFFITALNTRGAWPNSEIPKKFRWRHHARDLTHFMHKQYDAPVIGMGHSIGGTVSTLATIKNPDLFSHLILIDPATSPLLAQEWLMKWLPEEQKNKVPLIRSTLTRRTTWPDKQTFVEDIKTKKTYQDFTDEALNSYADHGLIERDNRFELYNSPAWEAHNFKNVVHLWSKLKKLKMPVLLLHAEHSNLYTEEKIAKQRKKAPNNITFKSMPDTGHLAPLENPKLVYDLINEWLAETL